MSGSDPGSDFDAEMRYHEHEWMLQRLGWLALLGCMICAMLGWFGGGGPFSVQTRSDPQLATLTFDRFARYAAPTRLHIRIADAPPRVALELDMTYLRDFEVTNILPTPMRTDVVDDRQRLTFDFHGGPLEIVMRLSPRAVGPKRGALTIAGSRIDFSQFIYP